MKTKELEMKTNNKMFRCSSAVSALVLAGAAATAVAGPKFSDWSESTATGLAGGCPIESRDGNKLFIAGGFDGTVDIFYYELNGSTKAFDTSSRTKVAD